MRHRRWVLFTLFALGLFLFRTAMAILPNVIYGDDDRIDYYQASPSLQSLADSTVALVRTASLEVNGDTVNLKTTAYGTGMGLCASEPFYSQETLAFCSGSLVAPNVILTAGHCIRSQLSCDSTRFVFGFRMNSETEIVKQVPASQVYACKRLIHSVANPQGEDFALVELDRPVTQVAPLNLGARSAVGDALTVLGHPAGLPLKIAGQAVVRRVEEQFMVTNLDTYGGNSGSAVVSSTSGQIVGVLVRGEMDYIYQNGCRVSNRCPSDGCRGEDVTLIERVLPHLPQPTVH
ncbi:MAG: serine protease [Bdellovibrionales bacterium]